MLTFTEVVDCEALHSGWPQQPVNGWSSVAFILAGLWIAFRSDATDSRRIGAATVLVGFGSLLFHAGDDRVGGWLHDFSILAVLVVLIASLTAASQLRNRMVAAALVAGAAIALLPGTAAQWSGVGLVAVLLLMVWISRHRHDPLRLVLTLIVAAVSAVLAALGQSDGLWCDPESLFQPHAGWHMGLAAATVIYWSARRSAT